MNDRIDLATRSPLAAARMCQESPEELTRALPEYRALSPDNRRRLDALFDGADADLGCRLVGLVRHEGFQACDADQQAILLGALGAHPDADTIGRIEELASDAEFQRMMPRDAAREAAEVRDGSAFPGVAEIIRASGARQHELHGFSLPGFAELSAHGVEVIGHIALECAAGTLVTTGAGMAAGTALSAIMPLATGVVALGAGLYGLARDHALGREWGEAVAEGRGFVDQMAHHLRGDDSVPPRGARGSGAEAANRYWESLSPSQRVELRTAEGVDATLRTLARNVERITIAGREAE